jgi:hypothetical protein
MLAEEFWKESRMLTIVAPFMVDTGVDRTVFSATILAALRLRPVAMQESLGGLGGAATSVLVVT